MTIIDGHAFLGKTIYMEQSVDTLIAIWTGSAWTSLLW